MRKLLPLLLVMAAAAFPARGSTVITATVTVTNYANITGTNAETITINGDVRTWTNLVATPASQIIIGTNIATTAQNLLTQLATYPATGLFLTGNGSSTVTMRAAADAPLVVAFSPTTYAYVSYVTNTITPASVVRIPYTVESAATQTNTANGLANWLNLPANTTGLSASKMLSGTLPVARLSGITTNTIDATFHEALAGTIDPDRLTGIDTNHLAASLYELLMLIDPSRITGTLVTNTLATTNCVIDFANGLQTIDAPSSFQILQTTNRPAASTASLVVRFLVNNVRATNISVVLNSAPGWKLDTVSPIVVTNGDCQEIVFRSRGASETNVVVGTRVYH